MTTLLVWALALVSGLAVAGAAGSDHSYNFRCWPNPIGVLSDSFSRISEHHHARSTQSHPSNHEHVTVWTLRGFVWREFVPVPRSDEANPFAQISMSAKQNAFSILRATVHAHHSTALSKLRCTSAQNQKMVGVVGFEPTNSCAQGKRVRPGFPTPRYSRESVKICRFAAHDATVAGFGSRLMKEVCDEFWSGPGRQSFVLSPEGSRTGPDFFDSRRNCTRSCRVGFSLGSGNGTRTHDLKLMRLPRCLCAIPHEAFVAQQDGPRNPPTALSKLRCTRTQTKKDRC